MLRNFIRAFAKSRGYEFLGYPRAWAAHRSLKGLLLQEDIDLVLDIGANTGQFADEIRAAGYDGQIISYEPQSSAHTVLSARASKDPKWLVADRTAIGAETGIAEINISGNSVSSSILAMLPSHSDATPESSYVSREMVPIRRLDDLCNLFSYQRVLLKVDVQGYEQQVLDGATCVLEGCRAVIVEMSLVPLYEGQVLAKELWDILAAKGFEVWALEPGIRSPETARMLQLDGVFVRTSKGQQHE